MKKKELRYEVGMIETQPICAFRYEVDAHQWAKDQARRLRQLPDNHGLWLRVFDVQQGRSNTYAVLV